jgi:lysophospholipase L1-like esterase
MDKSLQNISRPVIWGRAFVLTMMVLLCTVRPASAGSLTYTFTGTTIDTSVWTEHDTGGSGGTTGNVQQNDGLSITGTGVWATNGIESASTIARSGGIVSATFTVSATNKDFIPVGYGDYDWLSGSAHFVYFNASAEIRMLTYESGVATENTVIGSYTTGTYTAEIRMQTTGATIYLDSGSGLTQIGTLNNGTFTTKPYFAQSFNATCTLTSVTLTSSAFTQTAPSAISTLYAAGDDGQALLAWSSPATGGSPITNYLVDYRLYGATSWTSFSHPTSTTPRITVTGLTNDVFYQFRVRAVNSIGTATDSNIPYAEPLSSQFSDNFNSLTAGALGTQNGWQAAGGTWTVGTDNGSQVVSETAASGNFHTNVISNGSSAWHDQRVIVDFKGSDGSFNPHLWLRRSANTGDAGGYLLFRNVADWTIARHTAGSGATYTTLATAGSVSPSIVQGSWYTIEFEVTDNPDGDAVLNAYLYAQGGTRPAQPMVTYTDTATTFTSGYFGLGNVLNQQTYDNLAVYVDNALVITTPAHDVIGAPTTATLAITDEGGTFYIPYIQTSSTLSVAASVSGTYLPAGGGVKFVLNEGESNQDVKYDMTSPFTGSFTGVAKGNYTLDAYVVDSSQVVVAGSGRHAELTNVGIGDIITAIGDSITEGEYGVDAGTTSIASWLDAPAGTTSADNRNYPQYGPYITRYKESWMSDLNDELADFYDYPVFIMNEGYGGLQTGSYISYMGQADWISRQTALHPNRWLIHLGVNDAGTGNQSASTVQTNLQTIINTLENSYSATGSQILLARPSYGTSSEYTTRLPAYLPIIDSLVSSNALTAGPDFYTYFSNHNAGLYSDTVHPNSAGMVQMARLWALALMYPQGLGVSQNNGVVTITWNSLSAIESTINGYKVKYGTTSGTYTTTTDVGNVTSRNITALNPGQLYYFSVSAYDNDTGTINQTDDAPEVSLTYVSAAGGSSISNAPSVVVVTPNGGESLVAGQQYPVQWNSFGSGITSARISVSYDGGSNFSTVADGVTNTGSFTWIVPAIASSSVRMKVDLFSGTTVVASDTSNGTFSITVPASVTPEPVPETPPPPADDPTVSGTYDPLLATMSTPSIDVDKGLVPPQEGTALCQAGTLIKGSLSAVYYCGLDGRRYVFPDEKAYKTWYADFSGVSTIDDATLARIPLAGNVTMRPGVRMVKIQSDPKTYAVSRGGTLRWITSEAIAVSLYGARWNRQIVDVSDAFFVNYVIGAPITE